MNNTPRTDKQREIIDSIRPDGFHRVEHLLAFAAELETELAALTEQRDEYKLVLQSADSHNHEIATKLEIVTEQRDEARDTIAMLTNTLRNNNDAGKAEHEELKAELHRLVRAQCEKAIREYRAYRKIQPEAFQVWACSEKKGAMLLARRITRLLGRPNSQADR